MRTRTRVATAITTGVVATALLASPALARAQDGGIGPDQVRSSQQSAQQVGTCDGTGARLQDRDTTGDHLRLRIHQA